MSPERNTPQPRSALQLMKPYSPGKPIWEVQRELGLTHVIKLASNENPLGPSPKALEAIAAALPELHRYPDAQTADLREAIGGHYGFGQDAILVSNGADELITLVSEAFLELGDDIVIPSPSFSEYEFGAQLMGATVRSVPLGPGYRYSIEAIMQAVTPRTRIVYLCSPNNPTGTMLERANLKLLLDRLPRRVLVVLDAAYSHYATDEAYSEGLEFIREGYPLLVLQTFSKIYGLAGIRVGFGISSPSIIESMRQVKEPFNVNALAQAAAIAALSDREHVRRSRELVVQERERLYEGLRGLGIYYTESRSNFILIELGPNAEQLYNRLLQAGIIVRYGRTWGLPEHIRVSIGLPEENDRLVQELGKLVGNGT